MSQSKDFPDCFYRVSVRAFIRDGNKVLMGKRGDTWETFGGGLDFGEDPITALRRELEEETGLKAVSIQERPILAFPQVVRNRRDMEWYYSFLTYYETTVDIETFDPTHEYSEIRWCTVAEVADLALFEGEEGIKEEFKKLLQ